MLSHFQGPIHFYKTSDAKKTKVLIFSLERTAGIISTAECVFIAITS
jgi:hypothetical protein